MVRVGVNEDIIGLWETQTKGRVVSYRRTQLVREEGSPSELATILVKIYSKKNYNRQNMMLHTARYVSIFYRTVNTTVYI